MKKRKEKLDPRGTLFDDWLKEQLKDPEFKQLYIEEGIKLQLAIRIAELRKKAGLTQAQLAKKVGVTQGFIAQLESADTDNYEIKTLRKISEAIGVVLVIGFINKSDLKRHKSAPMKKLVAAA